MSKARREPSLIEKGVTSHDDAEGDPLLGAKGCLLQSSSCSCAEQTEAVLKHEHVWRFGTSKKDDLKAVESDRNPTKALLQRTEDESNPYSLTFSEREDCADVAENFETEAQVKAWKVQETFLDAQFTSFRPRRYDTPQKDQSLKTSFTK